MKKIIVVFIACIALLFGGKYVVKNSSATIPPQVFGSGIKVIGNSYLNITIDTTFINLIKFQDGSYLSSATLITKDDSVKMLSRYKFLLDSAIFQGEINGKQATLVSATNIKTINGNSILGSGDITILSDDSVKMLSVYGAKQIYQSKIVLTTKNNTGNATKSGDTLNIPNYSAVNTIPMPGTNKIPFRTQNTIIPLINISSNMVYIPDTVGAVNLYSVVIPFKTDGTHTVTFGGSFVPGSGNRGMDSIIPSPSNVVYTILVQCIGSGANRVYQYSVVYPLSTTSSPTYTFSTGLTNTSGTVTVNTSQNISTLSNLTSNGLVKTSGGTGALSIASPGMDYQAPISATLPVKYSSNIVSIDTGWHKSALSSYYQHQKDSINIASKQAVISATLPIMFSSNTVSVDSGWHKNALSSYYQHQKDSLALLLKANIADTGTYILGRTRAASTYQPLITTSTTINSGSIYSHGTQVPYQFTSSLFSLSQLSGNLTLSAWTSPNNGNFYTGTTNATNTTRLNYDGNFYAHLFSVAGDSGMTAQNWRNGVYGARGSGGGGITTANLPLHISGSNIYVDTSKTNTGVATYNDILKLKADTVPIHNVAITKTDTIGGSTTIGTNATSQVITQRYFNTHSGSSYTFNAPLINTSGTVNADTGKHVHALVTWTQHLKDSIAIASKQVAGSYAPATSGTSILKGNGSGGFNSASAGTDYQAPISATLPIKFSSNTISADTGYHKNALASYYQHQKDSIAIASKQVAGSYVLTNDTAHSGKGKVTNYRFVTDSAIWASGITGKAPTFTTSLPVKYSSNIVSIDTGYHKNALTTYYLHQKDSLALLLKAPIASPTFTGTVSVNQPSPTYSLETGGATSTSGIRTWTGLDFYQVPNPTTLSGILNTGTNLGIGAYYYAVAYVTTLGKTALYVIGSPIITTSNNQSVILTVPISSDSRTTGRKLYRCKVGVGNANLYLLTTIADNTTTSYTDNATDASLSGTIYDPSNSSNSTNKLISINGTSSMMIDPATTYVGYGLGNNVTSGGKNALFGAYAGQAITTGNSDIIIGYNTGYFTNTGYSDTYIGMQSGYNNTNGNNNTGCGMNTLFTGGSSSNCTAVGVGAGFTNGGNNCVYLGYFAGHYATTSNKLFIDNQDRTNALGDSTKALIYGYFNSAPASQQLTVNAQLNVTQPIIGNFIQPANSTATVLTESTNIVTWTPVLGVNVYTLTPNTTGAVDMGTIPSNMVGNEIDLVITTSGTSTYTLNFGTNIRSQGPLATGSVSAKIFIMKFLISSTTSVLEISRTTAM